MADLVGKTLLNRYHVVEFLGRGGMAEVYKVWDSDRMIHLAAKVLLKSLALDRVFLRRFKREADSLAKLQHPHIVRYYGLYQDGSTAFMLLDFIEGITLQELIFNQGLQINYETVNQILRSVCGALNYAHKQGMVHCDIKPANIMINQHNEVLITDFGIARMTDAATATMVGFGTPAYMAPELVMGKDPTPQSDIYSLGIVLYEMVTGGERPFTGERAETTGTTSEKVRWEQRHLSPPSPREHNPNLSKQLEAVILKCLAKTPQTRFASVRAVQTALEPLYAVSNYPSREKADQVSQKPEVLSEQKETPIMQSAARGDQAEFALKENIAVQREGAPQKTVVEKQRSEAGKKPTAVPTWVLWAGGATLIVSLLAVVIVLLGSGDPLESAVAVQPSETEAPLFVTNSTNTPAPTPTPTPSKNEVPTSTPTAEPTLGIGSTMVNPLDGAEMVYVPVGEFLMGSSDEDINWILEQSWCNNCVRDWFENEQPVHSVYLDNYWIYKHEVTNAQFAAYLNAEGNQGEGIFTWFDEVKGKIQLQGNKWVAYNGYGEHPVVAVSWYGAQSYCEWAGGRLPTEAEWEKAAKGTDGRIFTWGDTDITGLKANFCDLNCNFSWKDSNYDDGYKQTAPVDSFPAGASPYGALHMAGNVEEWVADLFIEDYYNLSPLTNPTGPESGNEYVLRGGSWNSTVISLWASNRFGAEPYNSWDFTGFRCAHSEAP